MTPEQAKTELARAKRALDDSVTIVAHSAQALSDNIESSHDGRGVDCYYVEPEDLVALRNALTHWKACTEGFLRAVDAVGTINYNKQLVSPEVLIYEAQALEDARAKREGRSPRLITRVEDIPDEAGL